MPGPSLPSSASTPTWMWWFRTGAATAASVTVLLAPGAIPAGIVEVAVAVAAYGLWRFADVRLAGRGRGEALKLAALIVLAGGGGAVVTSRHQGLLFTFAAVGVLAAGSELAPWPATIVLFAGVLGVEAGAIGAGNTSTGDVLGYPALLLALGVAGRYRRTYRLQAEQAHALLAETRRAQAEEQRAAALLERSRIAREIHDVLGHSLGALGIQLQAVEALLSERGDVAGALTRLAGAQRLVTEGLEESRRAVHALRSDTPPLPESIAALIGDAQAPDAGARLVVSGEPYGLAPAAGLALLRVAQEALVNVRRHAPGACALVTLDYEPARVRLVVGNPLASPAPAVDAPVSGGYGLAGMRERLRLIGGTLSTGARDGEWVVEASVPRLGAESLGGGAASPGDGAASPRDGAASPEDGAASPEDGAGGAPETGTTPR